MEQDILEQLYFGRIVPWENWNDKTPEIEQCSEQVYQDMEHLAQLLDEGGKDGFRLGVQLTAAGLGNKNKL